MGKTSKEGSDSKRKRKRVAVESSSDGDESEQDFEEVTKKLLRLKLDGLFCVWRSLRNLLYRCCWQGLKSLAKRSRQAQENSKPQKSGDSDSDLDSSEGSDDEVMNWKNG